MRLVTNSNNINSLKLVLASEISGIALDISYVSPSKESREILPVLEVSGSKLFIPSPAVIFLLQEGNWPGAKDDVISSQEELLDLETETIYPLVVNIIASAAQHKQGTPDPGLMAQLTSLLPMLETRLGDTSHLGGNSLGAVDILFWPDLYPLLTDNKLKKDLGQKFPNITKWFEKLAGQKKFSGATSKFGAGLDGCKGAVGSLFNISKTISSGSRTQGRSTSAAVTASTPAVTSVSAAEIEAAKTAWNSSPAQPKIRTGPILPHKGERNILVTSALPYVNNVPHLGNIVGCVLSADVYVRFARLRGSNVLYICGTDEYGTSTETKALEEGLTPREICDKYNKLHGEIYDWFNISFDKFGRTTTSEQTDISQKIFWDLHKAGCTSQNSVDQLYCCHCSRFLADRFVEGICPLCQFDDARGDQCDACGKLINASELIKPRCKLCSKTPEIRTSRHLFIELPKVEARLNTWLETSSEKWSNNAKVIGKSWLKGGLQPRCITRDLVWGTKVPLEGFTDKVFYVWFDAPIGYLSITAQYTEHWEKWWKNPDDVELWQFMAKDNVPFHSVVFPSTLLGTGQKWTMVNRLMSTEYLNYEDAKFSKSRGVGVFGNDAMDTGIPSDVWRFYLMYIRPENQDSAFKWDDLMVKNNSELLANLGNFINRATKFTKDNFDSCVPAMSFTDEDWEIVARVNQELESYISFLEDAREREAITAVFNISRLGNQLMQHNTPWKLVKGSETEKARAGTVVGLSVNLACLLSTLIQPYMPTFSSKLQSQLAAPAHVTNIIPEQFHCLLPPGHKIGDPSPLVEEIKQATIDQMKTRYAGKQSERTKVETTISPVPSGDANVLEAEVTSQGNKVRELKASKAEKAVINEAVKKLLELKKNLALAQATPSPLGDVTVLEAEVTSQGNKVRDLKASKAEKAVIDEAVKKLLEFKKNLALAQGVPVTAEKGKKGKQK